MRFRAKNTGGHKMPSFCLLIVFVKQIFLLLCQILGPSGVHLYCFILEDFNRERLSVYDHRCFSQISVRIVFVQVAVADLTVFVVDLFHNATVLDPVFIDPVAVLVFTVSGTQPIFRILKNLIFI